MDGAELYIGRNWPFWAGFDLGADRPGVDGLSQTSEIGDGVHEGSNSSV